MTTQKVNLRRVEEVMNDYVPIYTPIYTLLLPGAVSYPAEVGVNDFRRVEAVGDIRQHRITPKDTEIKQIAATDGKKSFRKYFFANQFKISSWQNREGIEEVIKQTLDEHQLQADELLLSGDGANAGSVLNNGLFNSQDPNYTLEDSVTIAADKRLYDLHAKVVMSALKADQTAGRKVLVFYGTAILPLVRSLYETGVKTFRAVLQEALPDYSIVELPQRATPAGGSGWMIINLDQVKLHYCLLPQLLGQGLNEENMYVWTNFGMGSMMVDIKAEDGVLRQPATLAA